MEKCNDKNLIKEKNTLELLNAILLEKNLKKVPKESWIILCGLLFVVIPLINYCFNALNISAQNIQTFFSDLLTVLSILIGFSITAVSMVGLGLAKETLVMVNNYKTGLYANMSIYKATIFVFFEYLYSLFISLFYIIAAEFILPHACKFYEHKSSITLLFFYTFIPLLYWNFLSIKSLVYNLYLVIMMNTMIIRRNAMKVRRRKRRFR